MYFLSLLAVHELHGRRMTHMIDFLCSDVSAPGAVQNREYLNEEKGLFGHRHKP